MTSLAVVNPFDLSVIEELTLHGEEHANRLLDGATSLYNDRQQWLPAHRRIEILEKTSEMMKARFEKLAMQIALEGGKPLVDARVEVRRAIDGVSLCVKELLHFKGEEIPMDLTAAGAGRLAWTTREPIGPVVAISAFNHPLNLIVHQVAPAVAVGCPVIVKPSEKTPLSAKCFVEILHEAGLPEPWCQLLVCNVPTTQKLAQDSRVAFVSFIGSSEVGWALRARLAPGTRCVLEHGGAAPVILDDTASMDAVLPRLVKGGFYHAGQVCVSVQRVFAPQSQAREIAERLGEMASRLVVGDATQENVDVGPLIRPREVDRVASWVDHAKKNGATVIVGGSKGSDTTYTPTVLFEPGPDEHVSKREIFGPVVNVYSYEKLDQAIESANSLPFPFQAAVFTERLDVAFRCAKELQAASVMVNDHTAFRVDWMPFAGHGQSGYGTGGMRYSMRDMSCEKLLVFNMN